MKKAIFALVIFSSIASAVVIRTVEVCPNFKQVITSDGDKVTQCTEFYSESPFVRPPVDNFSKSESVIFFGTFMISNEELEGMPGNYFTNRDGDRFFPVDAQGIGLAVNMLPASMKMPTYRTAFMIYEVSAKIKASKKFEGNNLYTVELIDVRPSILLDGCALDGLALGLWEGVVSKRKSENKYDHSDLVPFQIKFEKMNKVKNLNDWGGKVLRDGTSYKLSGKITNFNQEITASEGSKFPALVRLQESNPFHDSQDGEVEFYRFPGMHTPADRNSVIEWPLQSGDTEGGMVPLMLTSPWAALLKSIPATTYDFIYHGMPNGFLMKIKPVKLGNVRPTCSKS